MGVPTASELTLQNEVRHLREQIARLERKRQARKGPGEREQSYRSLFDEMTEGCAVHEIICDEQGVPCDYRFLEINPAFERLTGLKRDEVVGKTMKQVLPHDDPKWIQAYGEVSLTGKPARFENYSPELKRHYDVKAYRNAPGQFVVIFSDVTDRKLTEDALSGSEELLRAVTDNSPDAIYVKDRSSRWLMANPAVLRIVGKTAEQALGKTDLELYPEAAVGHAILENDRRIMEVGRAEAFEEVADTPDGRRIFLSVKAPRRDAQGNIVGLVGISRDITERKQADMALRQFNQQLEQRVAERTAELVEASGKMHAERQRFLNMLDTLPVIVDIIREDYRIDWANRAYREALGDNVGRLCYESQFGCGEPCEECQAFVPLRTGQPHHWEWTLPNGRSFDIYNFPFAASDGTPAVLEMDIDITERRRAEDLLRNMNATLEQRVRERTAELRESEEQFRVLTQNLQSAVALVDERGAFRIVNSSFLSMFDVPPNTDILNLNSLDWARWQVFDERGLLLDLNEHPVRKAALTGAAVKNQLVAMKSPCNSDLKWLLISAEPILDANGKLHRLICTYYDITDRKRAEAEIRESRNKYQALIETTSDFIWEMDAQGRYAYCSPQMQTLWGLNPKEMIGKTPFDVMPEEHKKGAIESFLAFVKSARPFRGLESVAYDGQGRLIHIEISGAPFFADDGSLLGFRGVTRDITERRHSEEHLRQAQKLESLGLLAGGVAHDFNNLLVGVIGNASLAQEMLPPGHPATELIETVVKTGEQASHLTRQMLAYSGKGKFLLEALNISALVHDIVELVRPSIPKKVVLNLDLGEDLPSIEADRGQVQQVLMNLTINAAEAIGSHDGLITVRTGTQVVDDEYLGRCPEVVGLAPGEYVLLEVRDTGCGMDDATKERIFDPFFSTKFTGRGLGLAAVAGIVRGHKGAIVVTTAIGKGTTFAVLFPRTAQPAGKSLEVVPAVSPQGSGVVLVIDDEHVVRGMAKKALERHGYTVLLADGGLAAIDVLKRFPGEIDLAVLDLSMPGLSGEETLPALRKIRPEIKVLVSSGYSESEAMTMFRGQRVSGFIQKPYTSAALADKVKSALR